MHYVAKTKVLISFAVTAKLICTFVFASADCWFSHVVAHLCKNAIFVSIFYPKKIEIEFLKVYISESNVIVKYIYGLSSSIINTCFKLAKNKGAAVQ